MCEDICEYCGNKMEVKTTEFEEHFECSCGKLYELSGKEI